MSGEFEGWKKIELLTSSKGKNKKLAFGNIVLDSDNNRCNIEDPEDAWDINKLIDMVYDHYGDPEYTDRIFRCKAFMKDLTVNVRLLFVCCSFIILC